MEKNRCIVLVRESTTAQDITSQKEEAYNAAISAGYAPADIIIIGQAGSSAIKQNEQYVADMERVLELIRTDKTVKEIFVWAIDRIGRKPKYLFEIRDAVYQYKVQLTILNPWLQLLTPTLEPSDTSKMAYGLFATMAELEMEHKKARFARAKKHNAEVGKYSGGRTMPFGYAVDSNGFFVPDEDEVAFIKMAFEMFATGKYSVLKLAKELDELGYRKRGERISRRVLIRILTTTIYIGKSTYIDPKSKEERERNYPAIISEELFDKVKAQLAANNKTVAKERKHYYFGNRIIRCDECGYSYVVTKGSYRCGGYAMAHQNRAIGIDGCHNGLTVNAGVIDGVLWYYSIQKHFDFLLEDKSTAIQQYQQTIASNTQKIATESVAMADFDAEKERIDDIYLMGRLTKEKYQSKLADVDARAAELKNRLLSLKEENERLQAMIDELENDDTDMEQLVAMVERTQQLEDEKEMSEIVHKYVKVVHLTRDNYEGKKCVIIDITFIDGDIKTIHYFPNNKLQKLFMLSPTNKLNELEIEPIERGDTGTAFTKTTRRYNRAKAATPDEYRKMPLVQLLLEKLILKGAMK